MEFVNELVQNVNIFQCHVCLQVPKIKIYIHIIIILVYVNDYRVTIG